MADVDMDSVATAAMLAPMLAATPVAAPASVPVDTLADTDTTAPVVRKKRRTERREQLKKTLICKHFDKPGGCPFANCKYAHGRSEVQDGGKITVAAQRQLIRDQTISRAEDKFLATDGATPASLRGTMIERYYTELFACDIMGKALEDQYVHMHSNRLCVVGVAASHPVLAAGVASVAFAANVLASKVAGKKKKGGHFLEPGTILCHITSTTGVVYAMRSNIRGALIEVNERLITTPQLLQNKAQSDGYLVIIQPKLIEIAEIQDSLLSKREYLQFIAIRATQATANSNDAVNDAATGDDVVTTVAEAAEVADVADVAPAVPASDETISPLSETTTAPAP